LRDVATKNNINIIVQNTNENMIDHSQDQSSKMKKVPDSSAIAASSNDLKQDATARNDSTFGSFASSFITAEDLAATGKAIFKSALEYNDTACSTPGAATVTNAVTNGSEQQQQQTLRKALRRARSRSRSNIAKRHPDSIDANKKGLVPGKQEQRDEVSICGNKAFKSGNSVSTVPFTNVTATSTFENTHDEGPAARQAEIRGFVDTELGTRYSRNLYRGTCRPAGQLQCQHHVDEQVARQMTALRLGSQTSSKHEEKHEGASLQPRSNSVSHNLRKEVVTQRRRKSMAGHYQGDRQEEGNLRGIHIRQVNRSSLQNQPKNADDDRLDKVSRDREQLQREKHGSIDFSEHERVARQRSVQRRRDLEEETEHEEWLAKRIRRDMEAKIAADFHREEQRLRVLEARASPDEQNNTNDDVDELMGQRFKDYEDKTGINNHATRLNQGSDAKPQLTQAVENVVKNDELMGPKLQAEAVEKSNHDELMGPAQKVAKHDKLAGSNHLEEADKAGYDEIMGPDYQEEVDKPGSSEVKEGDHMEHTESANPEESESPDQHNGEQVNTDYQQVSATLPPNIKENAGSVNKETVVPDATQLHQEEEVDELMNVVQEKVSPSSCSQKELTGTKVISPASSSIATLSTYQAQAARTVFDSFASSTDDNEGAATIFNPTAMAAYQHELDVLSMDPSTLASENDLELKHILNNPIARGFYLSMSQTLCNAVTGCEALAATSSEESKAFHSFRKQLAKAISRDGVKAAQKNIITSSTSKAIGEVLKELGKQPPTPGYKLSCASLLSKLLSNNEIKHCRQVSYVCIFAALAERDQGMTEIMKQTARLVIRALNGMGVGFEGMVKAKFGQVGTATKQDDSLLDTSAKECGVRAATNALRVLMKPKKNKSLTKITKHNNSKTPLAEALASAVLDNVDSFRELAPFGQQRASTTTPSHDNPQQATAFYGTTSTNHYDELDLSNNGNNSTTQSSINSLILRQQQRTTTSESAAWMMEIPPALGEIISLLNEDAERKNDMIAELASINADLMRRIEVLEQQQLAESTLD
jgi:hypothetical protein